jgi:hypothetical protein
MTPDGHCFLKGLCVEDYQKSGEWTPVMAI